jgi:hypothetical protein
VQGRTPPLRMDFNLLDLTPYGRQEKWEDSPAGWPQSPTTEWMPLRDEYRSRREAPVPDPEIWRTRLPVRCVV